jgi:hypothetical protein
VVRRDDEGERVPADQLGVQAVRHAGALDEADVGGVGQHGLGHLGRVNRGQRHDRSGVDRAQRGQPRREQVLGHGHAGRDAQPGVALPAQRRQAGVQRFRRVHRDLRPARHQCAGRRQLGTARGPLDQGQAELPLEQPHPGAGGGLGDAVLGRRAPDTAGTRHAEQQVEAGQVGYPRRQRHK